MNEDERYILKKIGQFLLAAFLMTLALAVMGLLVYHDFKADHYLREGGWTENAQFLFLCFSAFCYWRGARIYQKRGLYLVGGFIGCMAVREMDSFFDKALFHGAWTYIALALAFFCIYLALRKGGREETGRSLAAFLQSKSYFVLAVGLIWVLLVSRVYGMGVLWRLVVDRRLAGIFKNFVEESMETVGFMIIAAAAVYCLSELRAAAKKKKEEHLTSS